VPTLVPSPLATSAPNGGVLPSAVIRRKTAERPAFSVSNFTFTTAPGVGATCWVVDLSSTFIGNPFGSIST
jgi:hypothetical protein